MEYLMVLSTGFVALLAGGEALAGETDSGEVFRAEGPWGGDREAGRDTGRTAGVLGPLGGAGGGVDGGSGLLSRARSVRLLPEPALTEAGPPVGAKTCVVP
jgi:hypothetical protein